MFDTDETELTTMGAQITTREIKQQPELWQETSQNFVKNNSNIANFIDKIKAETSGCVRVIFTGAGTSAYVGDTIVPYLTKNGDRSHFSFESIPSTSIVSAPYDYLEADTPTLLVSFARSGNSPESVAAVELAEQIVKQLYQLTITCYAGGKLVQRMENKAENLILLQPEANDQGFAMTGSFSCMTLTALLVFDQLDMEKKKKYIDTLVEMAHELIDRESEIQALVDEDFNRIAYLGSGSLAGLTREAQLKVLELTAGKLATIFDSSMGFRHGPKSFINQQTLVFDFLSNDRYTRQYDIDILEEIRNDQIAKRAVAVGIRQGKNFTGDSFIFETGDPDLPDVYLALPDILFAQTLALLSSIKVGNKPDTPSSNGTVNRVVKGVILYPYSAE